MWYCKHCGQSFRSLLALKFGRCANSPTGKHERFLGETDGRFVCKHCGQAFKSLSFLVHGHCTKSPTAFILGPQRYKNIF